MRRPPDKSGSSAVSERDVESSNATLNAVFGGARQKSWMTATGPPVHPTPRRPSKPSLPTMQELENTPTTAVLLSPTPSGTASPLLHSSDVPQQSSAHPPPASIQIPATSGLRSPAEATAPATHSPQLQSRGQSHSSPSQASSNQGSPLVPMEHLQAPVTANIPYPQARERRSSPRGTQSPILISESPVQAHAQIPSQRPRQGRTVLRGVQSPVEVPGSPAQAYPQPLPQVSRPRGRPPSIRPPHYEHTFSLATGSYAHQTQIPLQPTPHPLGIAPGSPAVPPRPESSGPNDQRISSLSSRQPQTSVQPGGVPSPGIPPQNPAWQFQPLKNQVASIQAHINSVGGTQNLNNSLDRPRFQLLSDACDTQDVFYVVLHQIFCTWDHDPTQLLSISGLPTKNVLTLAFAVLGQLIRPNQGMATYHLRFFAAFPNSLEHLWTSSEAYRRVVADVGVFLSRLALQWAQFSALCLERQYPPLIDELVNGLGILSHILQGVVFTATRRNLGLPDEPFGPWAEKLFHEDRKGYQELSVRYRTQDPQYGLEVLKHNQSLATRYCSRRGMQPQAHNSGQTGIAPRARPPTQPTSAQIAQFQRSQLPTQLTNASQFNANQPPVLPSQNTDQTPRYTNPQGPDRETNQHSQPATAISAQSPNLPAAMTRRPPWPAGRQLNTGTAGLSLFEDLTIVSPIVSAEVTASPVVPSQGTPGVDRAPPVPRSNNIQGRSIPSLSAAEGTMTTTGPQSTARPQAGSDLPAEVPREGPVPGQVSLRQPQRQRQSQNQIPQQQLPIPVDQPHTTDVPNVLVRQRRFPSEIRPTAAPTNQAGRMIQNAVPRSLSRTQSQLQNGAGGRAPGALVAQPRVPDPRRGPQPDPQKMQLHSGLGSPLLPPLGYTRPNEAPNPNLTALHQARACSPILARAYMLDPSLPPPDDNGPRFYQCVKEFALEPSKIAATASLSTFRFVVSEAALSMKAHDKPGQSPGLVARGYVRGTLQFRLRCVQARGNTEAYGMPEWSVSDTTWPETVFIQVNGRSVEIRRKAHHSKDLPADITNYISHAAPGHSSANIIKISTPRPSKYHDIRTYFVAVEVVEILDHPFIIGMCKQQLIPASKTLNAIKKALAGPPIDDDDEISMVVSDLSIDLADPFTSRIFDVPVRGRSCLHRECFDLATFLETRKSKFIAQPCLVDVWKCPLCSADARPYSLVIDQFFFDIRDKLAQDDNLDVKAILVSADGTWKPKVESPLKRKSSHRPDESDDEDEGPSAKQRILAGAAASRAASMEARQARDSANRVVEVIELDD